MCNQHSETIKRMVAALRINIHCNPLGNDLDAYLYEVCWWALGGVVKPDPADYGIELKPAAPEKA